MTTTSKFAFVALLVTMTSCISTTHDAQMSGIDTGNSDMSYSTSLKGRLSGSGSSFMLSPGFFAFPGAPTSASKAIDSAIGDAMWEEEGVDAMIGVKSKIETTNFLGIFEVSRAQVKGIGVGVDIGQ